MESETGLPLFYDNKTDTVENVFHGLLCRLVSDAPADEALEAGERDIDHARFKDRALHLLPYLRTSFRCHGL